MIKYISIEGIIGSGKTTLAEQLYEYLKTSYPIALLKERFERNKLLELFYYSPPTYGVLTEYSFLIDRFHQIQHHFEKYPEHLHISDFCFRKCLWFAQNNLNDSEYKEYEKHFLTLENALNIQPDKIIFLDIKPEQAYKNIQQRGRPMEQKIDLQYLHSLYDTYWKNLQNTHLNVVIISAPTYNDIFQKLLEQVVE